MDITSAGFRLKWDKFREKNNDELMEKELMFEEHYVPEDGVVSFSQEKFCDKTKNCILIVEELS